MKGKKKRRRPKPTAAPNRITSFLLDILAGIIAGLITALLFRWFGW